MYRPGLGIKIPGGDSVVQRVESHPCVFAFWTRLHASAIIINHALTIPDRSLVSIVMCFFKVLSRLECLSVENVLGSVQVCAVKNSERAKKASERAT